MNSDAASIIIRELHLTLGKLDIALGAVSDAIVWTDDGGRVQWCNAGCDRLLGRPHIASLGVRLADVLPLRLGSVPVPDELHPVKELLAGREPAPGPYEFTVGERASLLLELRGAGVDIGGRRGAVLLIRDVTLSARRDEALRQSEERHRLIVDNVRDYAIFMLDASGRVASWNAGAEHIMGYSAEEIIGRHFSCFYPEGDAHAAKPDADLAAVAAEGRVEDEGFRSRKDGSRFWASVVLSALRGPQGGRLGFVMVARDLSRRKQAEDALHAAKVAAEASSRELEIFSYSVAHDLRAPLRTIDGFSKVLLEGYLQLLDEAGQGYLRSVRAGVARMSHLIDDLLALSRVTRAELRRERVDLSALAEEVARALRASQPGRAVEFAIAPGLVAEGDVVLLRSVLENLLGNAWKYTGRHPRARIEFGVRRSAAGPVYFVRDDGAGFDMAYMSKLFTPFSRLHGPREFEGNGIGLATVQRAVQRHRGRVCAEGWPEGGATFYFTLWEEGS